MIAGGGVIPPSEQEAQAWSKFSLPNRPVDPRLIWAVQFLPYLLAGLAAGALVDRWRRRSVLVISNTAQGLLLLLVPVLWALGHLTIRRRLHAPSATRRTATFADVAATLATLHGTLPGPSIVQDWLDHPFSVRCISTSVSLGCREATPAALIQQQLLTSAHEPGMSSSRILRTGDSATGSVEMAMSAVPMTAVGQVDRACMDSPAKSAPTDSAPQDSSR